MTLTLDRTQSFNGSIAALVAAIRSAQDAETANDVRARVQAARAWAKAHKQLETFRKELLVLEVEALSRVWELGGADLLSGSERAAAKALADLGSEGRRTLIDEYESVTTATGLIAAQRAADRTAAREDDGRRWAARPPFTPSDDSVSGRLAALVDRFTEEGVPFAVATLADELINTYDWEGSDDPAFRDGVNKMCRQMLRQDVPSHAGIPLPRWLTIQTEDGDYLRVPIGVASLDHLRAHIAVREAQLADDRRAILRLKRSFKKLSSLGSGDSDARIGELLLRAAATERAE